jgi:hypothetical protein
MLVRIAPERRSLGGAAYLARSIQLGAQTAIDGIISRGKTMTLSDLFAYLGAPLANMRWSWGAVRATDSAVFLRVWQDEGQKIDGRYFTRISANAYFLANEPKNLGYMERSRHIDLIRGGARSYMIMCRGRDIEGSPREIVGFDDSEVFVGGELIELEGESWLQRVGRKPRAELRAIPTR